MKKYPLSKEELSLFLACTINPMKYAYWMGFSVKFPADEDTERIKNAIRKVFERHPILNARYTQDENGEFYKYDCGEPLKLEEITIDTDEPDQYDYYPEYGPEAGAVYRAILFTAPNSKILMVPLHHMVMDGTSRKNLLTDLEKAYRGEDLGEPLLFPYELGIREKEQESLPQYEEDRQWYMRHLDGVESFYPEPDLHEDNISFGQFLYPFDNISGEKVKEKKNSSGVRTSTIFLGAMGYTLAMYSGTDESVIASAMSGRVKGLEEAAGMFVRTFPTISRIRPDRTVDEYLADLDQQTTDGRKHSLFTYMDMAHELDLSLKVSFAYQGDMASTTMLFDGREVGIGNIRANESDYDMRLYLWRMNGKYIFEPVYRSNLYSREFMENFSAAFEQVLNEMLSAEKLSDINVLSQEQEEKLDRFNETDTEYEYTDVVTLFRRMVSKYPDKNAVVFNDITVTYRELDEVSERIGAHLKGQGIGTEDVVSILINRSQYMAIASIGVLKSGAAYQPLDASYPPERLEFMINDASAKLLIADRELVKKCVPGYTGPILYIDEIEALPQADRIETTPAPEDRFIMLYTSGSTGVPKGVILEHGNLTTYISWYRKNQNLTPESVTAAYASYGFDANMLDMYPTLTTGSTLVIIPEEIRLDLMAINEYYNKHGVTKGFMTTQVGRQFMEFYRGDKLETLSVGGEKLAPIYIDNGVDLVNIYGPTECTVNVTSFTVDKLYHRIPIGVPNDNTKLYVVDPEGRRVPTGAPGELIVSGRQVGRGYLNRPEKTAEVFIENPFDKDEKYIRAYRTGDIVRILPNGLVDFVGRNDGQVKIRGFRIEMPEVENVIREYPDIRDVTVQAFDEASGGKFIAAYIVSDKTIDIKSLNDFILERKPPYMVPAVTMQIDSIPLNQNQKVNKKALPTPEFSDEEQEEDNREKTLLEEQIIEVLGSVFSGGKIGVSGSLKNYGLDSINAIRVVPMLKERFGVIIPVVELVGGMSVADIETTIIKAWNDIVMNKGASDEGTVPGVSAQTAADEKGQFPLSSVQLGVYYDEARRDNSECLYNIPMCYAFDDVNASELKSAVEKVVAAHGNLSTRMVSDGGQIKQTRVDEEPEVSLLKMSEEEFSDFKEDFVRPFVITKDRLYRFAGVDTPEKTYLLQDIHHLVFDGLSSAILINEICKALAGEDIPAEEYDYFDYVADEIADKESGKLQESGEFFDKMFSDYEEPVSIPTDLSGQEEEGSIGTCEAVIGKDEVDKLAKEASSTPSSVFLAAVFYAASRFASTDKVYLSTISSGRDGINTNRSIGMFVHTIPLFMDFSENMSGSDLIGRSEEVIRDSVRNERWPFTEIASKYRYRTELMYEYQVGVASDSGKDISYTRSSLRLEQPKFKTTVAITGTDDSYHIGIRYNDALYSEESMKLFAGCVKNVLTHLAADPSGEVKKLSMMDETMRSQVTDFGSCKHVDRDVELLHKMIEKAAVENPDRNAVIASDKTLTFMQLNSIANIIAHELMSRGVGSGDSVVLLLPRRAYYFSAMFGVLKTGAAFIPCDPEYPADRIAHILSDADAKYIITTDEHEQEHERDKVLNISSLLTVNGANIYENTGLIDDPGAPDTDVNPEDLAYMIYTSGSTGKPKGVELTHRGIVNYVSADEASPFFYYVLNEMSAIVSVTTVSFDMSFKDTVGILCNGKTVIFANEEQMNDPRALTELLEGKGADTFSATPSRLLQYLTYEPFEEALKKCRLIICGGEAYPKSLLERLQGYNGPRLMNSYGPTEITVSSNMAELTNADHISVGRPLPNYDEYIVDSDGNPVPQGVTGELLVGGPGVARGYRGLPEMTAKNFTEYRGQRVYHTGDYAKWDPEGNVIILGRKDNQIKLRGLRIELDEIIGLIEKQPSITKAVVVIRSINGQDNLCAYFTADETIDIEKLRDALKSKLTHYMVPTAYLQMDSIPVTANGKLDTKNLPEPQTVERGEYVEPVGEIESFFCETFASVLKLDKVGAEDDFFELGGTSLVVTSVVIAAQEKGYTLNYSDVFKYTTPRQLTMLFSEDVPAESVSGSAVFDKYDYDGINEILKDNTVENFLEGESREIGNIFLTGATGYMGMHVLAEYLRSEKGKAYCLVRKGSYSSPKSRLKNLLIYYFDREFVDVLEDRVIAVDGDVVSYDVFESLENEPIDTVFNCAASVKHFSNGTDIEDINIGGAVNCIRFCEKTGARLIHFSTTSVGGHIVVPPEQKPPVLTEKTLYFGQILDNQYVSSKMLAERAVFEAIAERGLDAKVIRVGTLAARESDGEFQINAVTNSFMRRLNSYQMLGCFPYTMINQSLRLGPIDVSAKAFMLLARTPSKCCLFHAINNNVVPFIHVIRQMQNEGMDVRLVEDCVFDKAMAEAEKDPEKASLLQSILAYKNLGGSKAVPIAADCNYTTQVLARFGFFWNSTTDNYIYNFIDALGGLGFFDDIEK